MTNLINQIKLLLNTLLVWLFNTLHYKQLHLKSNLKMVRSVGSFFGELCLMGKPYRRLNAFALTDCVLLELNQVAFD